MVPDLADARRWCEEQRDGLLELARIHAEDIDRGSRKPGADEPDWVLRLRKVCLHAVSVAKCEVDVDGLHAMAPDLRAAYEQMDAVWKCLPAEYRIEKDRNWWSDEARNGLAAYCHPTMTSLMLPVASGGFADVESPVAHLRFTAWLGRLGCGYALALGHLARILGADVQDVDSSIESLVSRVQVSLPNPAHRDPRAR